jgi:HK97 family phage prohead protease
MERNAMAFETRALGNGALTFTSEGGKPRIDGRAIVFDSWSVDLGGFRERMMPNSVELDPDLVALFDHATDKVLGRTSAGTMEVRSDTKGVAFTAYPPQTTWANDLRVSMERGDIKGCSYRMFVDEDRWYVQDGMVCRDVLKARVSELTVTSMPAYPETTAEARDRATQLAKAAGVEARAGRVLSDANEQVLKGALGQIETAADAIGTVLQQVDPSFDEDQVEAPEVEEPATVVDGVLMGDHAGITPNSEMLSGGSLDEANRSSAGAAETPNRQGQTFVFGFGFIPNRKEN